MYLKLELHTHINNQECFGFVIPQRIEYQVKFQVNQVSYRLSQDYQRTFNQCCEQDPEYYSITWPGCPTGKLKCHFYCIWQMFLFAWSDVNVSWSHIKIKTKFPGNNFSSPCLRHIKASNFTPSQAQCSARLETWLWAFNSSHSHFIRSHSFLFCSLRP